MKRLILLRHGKSRWTDTDIPDHDRPLAPRGERAAVLMGRYLRQIEQPIDLVLSSTAKRARDTWALAATQIDGLIPTRTDGGIYLKGSDGLLDRIQEIEDGVANLLVVGHNPDLEDLCQLLAEDGDNALRGAAAKKFPTGAVAILDLDIDDWVDLPGSTGKLVDFKAPKNLV
ncbi:MAG: histidine phosphatase family protein [Azospirillaceae bacterium]